MLNVVLIGALALRTPSPATSAVPAPDFTALSTPARPASPTPSARPTSAGSPTSAAAPSATPSPSTSPSTSPSPSPTPEPARPTADADRVLAASTTRVAWRAERTRCGSSSPVEVTTNGGRSWSRTRPGIGAIVRLKTYDDRSVFAIGADSRCRATFAWTTGPGEPWQRDRSRASDIWYRTPKDLDVVHAPSGKRSRPCGDGLVALAGLGTYQAAALCADGRIRTDDEGRSWRTVSRSTGAVSLNADDAEFVAASVRRGCAGVIVQRFDADGSGLGRSGKCRTGLSARTGSTAVAIRDDAVWLWAGSKVVRP